MSDSEFTTNVLSIDATKPEITAVVTTLHGEELEVRKAVSIDGTPWWNSHYRDSANTEENDSSEKSGNHTFPLNYLLQQLSEFTWEESIIVLPPLNALALHLELPFSMKKSLQRIAPLETQDKIPFDLTPFLCHATPLRKLTDEIYDIHIDLFPKSLIESVMKGCKQNGIDPAVVTIPAALGELCYALYPKYISKNSVIVFSSPLGYSCSIMFDGKPISHFHLHGDPHSNNGSRPQSPYIEQSLNVAISHAEQRFEDEIEKIYFVGSQDDFSFCNPKRILKPCELIGYDDLLPKCQEHAGLNTLAATALIDAPKTNLLPNYRNGEFAYRPQFRNLKEGLDTLLYPFLLVLLGLIIVLPILYQVREYRIAKLEDQAYNAIQMALPHRSIQPGEELSILSNELSSANNLLKRLGTGSSAEPQKELALILEEINPENATTATTIRSLRLSPDRTVIEGTVSSYQDAERLEEIYKQPDSRYCKVKLEATGARGRSGTRNFELELIKDCE